MSILPEKHNRQTGSRGEREKKDRQGSKNIWQEDDLEGRKDTRHESGVRTRTHSVQEEGEENGCSIRPSHIHKHTDTSISCS